MNQDIAADHKTDHFRVAGHKAIQDRYVNHKMTDCGTDRGPQTELWNIEQT